MFKTVGICHFAHTTYRCGHCQSLVPIWKEVAAALKGIIHVAAIDADAHKSLAGYLPLLQYLGDTPVLEADRGLVTLSIKVS